MGSILAFAWGACLGSFLNVVVHRWPKGESFWRGSSRCPKCRKAIPFYDNVPILGWFLLRGRCRFCRGAISPRYPAVELAMAGLSLALWRRWELFPAWAALTVAAAAGLMAILLIDWDTFLIPDGLSLGLLGLGLAGSPINPLLGSSWLWRIAAALTGAIAGLAIGWGTAWAGEKAFKREALGGGDVKLLAAVGAWSGAVGAFDCMLVGSFLGSVYGVGLIAAGRLKRYEPIPFGPFLSASAIFNFFYLLPFGFPFL